MKLQLKRVIKELDGAVLGVEIDIDKDQDIAKQAGINGTPTVQLFKEKLLKKQWQGVIGQFAIPILDSQAVWMSGTPTKIAYMNTQDMAKVIVAAVNNPKTHRTSLPLVGPKAWDSNEVISLCEKFSEKKAKIFRVSPFLISVTQKVVSFFQDSLNVAERLAFAEVTSSGESLDADMSKTYEILDLKKEDMTSLESYIKEYYQQILKRLKEMEADLNIEEKRITFLILQF